MAATPWCRRQRVWRVRRSLETRASSTRKALRARHILAALAVLGIVERYVEASRTGDTSRLDEIIAPDFRLRLAAPIGVEGVAAFVRALHAGFT
jgi:hypothetical protein